MQIAVAVSGVGEEDLAFVEEAERLGADSVWLAEAWGYDAFTPLAFLAARTSRIRLATGIAQLGARTPALLAMSSMSMQALSGDRFLLGLGTSGPQVMEGWHGVRFSTPLAMTRETIEILRTVTAGERLTHDGAVYQLPLPDSAGRAIRSMPPPVRVPVYLAALGPKKPGAGRGAGRRLARQRVHARDGGRVPRAAGRRRRPSRPDRRRPRRRRPGGGAVHRRRGGGRPSARARLRLHHRRDGQPQPELLQRRLRATGLRRRRPRRAGAVVGRRPRTGRRPGAAGSRPAHQPARPPRGGGRADRALPERRRHHPPGEADRVAGRAAGHPRHARGVVWRARRAESLSAVRYADGPTVEVQVPVDAPPAAVWALVSDIPSRP